MKSSRKSLRACTRALLVASLAVASPNLFAYAQAIGQESINTTYDAYPVDPYTAIRPNLRALGTDDDIEIDGRLNEAAWSRADSTSGEFIQIQPNPGYPMTERTVIRIMYDEHNVYIGAELFDSEPDHVSIPGLEQDYATHDSDIFGISIDS